MTTPTSDARPSWEGIPEPVLLHEGVGVGGWIVSIFLSIVTFGLLVPFLAWDYLRRANAVGRAGIHTYVGVLPWTELEHVEILTTHAGRRGTITGTVHMVRLKFRARTIDVGPWGAPQPRLALRALSAGVGRTLDIPQPTGHVKWTRDA